METLNYQEKKANKDHICDFCGCKIDKDTKYNYSTYKDGFEFWTWKNHIKCGHLVRLLEMDDDNSGVTNEHFVNCIIDYYENEYNINPLIANIPWKTVMETVWKDFNLL